MTCNIALIGCGEIGSRHLQALSLLDDKVSLFAVDPNTAARTTASTRLGEQSPHRLNQVNFLAQVEALPEDISLAVIATSSAHRLDALEKLLQRSTVEQIILEKVLFQRETDYETAQQLLTESSTNAWVNCPRRMMKFFQTLSPYLTGHGPLNLFVEGTGWGLACNAIHFIDILAMYVGTSRYDLSTAGLDRLLHDSKRSNFVEFTGNLTGSFERNKGSFILTCGPGDEVSYRTTFENDSFRIIFQAPGNRAVIHNKMEQSHTEIDFELEYQSSLTNVVARQLLDTGHCDLPSYAESMELHLPMIAGFGGFIESVSGEPQDRVHIT